MPGGLSVSKIDCLAAAVLRLLATAHDTYLMFVQCNYSVPYHPYAYLSPV